MTARFRDSSTIDFVVVGSGAAGGVMARELAQAGFDVVLMEQGPRFKAQDFRHDELKNWFDHGITNDPARNPQSFRKTSRDRAADIARASGDKSDFSGEIHHVSPIQLLFEPFTT